MDERRTAPMSQCEMEVKFTKETEKTIKLLKNEKSSGVTLSTCQLNN